MTGGRLGIVQALIFTVPIVVVFAIVMYRRMRGGPLMGHRSRPRATTKKRRKRRR